MVVFGQNRRCGIEITIITQVGYEMELSKEPEHMLHAKWTYTFWPIYQIQINQSVSYCWVIVGTAWDPSCWALRILHIFWWFFAIMMSAAYTGNLIASLAVPQVSVPFRSLQDLASQSEYTVGIEDGTALQSVFKVGLTESSPIIEPICSNVIMSEIIWEYCWGRYAVYTLSNVILVDEKLTLFHQYLRYCGTIVFSIPSAIL